MKLSAILSDPAYPALKQYVLDHTGLAYYAAKDEDFAARLARRLTACNAASCADYLRILSRAQAGHSEVDDLVGELTIGETYFFRQSEHFDLLRTTIIPSLLLENAETRKLRIWSAGCAIGAEPYSVAMLLEQEFAAALRGWDVSILGTDINIGFLSQARSGSFSDWTLRDVPESLRTCCFTRRGNRWILNAGFRDAVTFRYHNLTDDESHPSPGDSAFDLIFCRNVMIYFAAERIRALGQRFYSLLNPGGWFLPGHAEYSQELFSQFELVSTPKAAVYRKGFADRPAAVEAPARAWEPCVFPPEVRYSVALPEQTALPKAQMHPPAENALSETNSIPVSLEDARLLADRGQGEEAAAICHKLLAMDRLNAPAHFTLGLISSHEGAAGAAADHFRRAIYADRQFALAYYYLGTTLQIQNDAPGARKAFRNTLELLTPLPADQPLAHGDGIQVEELRALARMHEESIAR